MERMIQYRAWDNVDKKMYYTGEEDNIHFYFDSNGIVAERFFNTIVQTVEGDQYECGDSEVLYHLQYMQYTGLNDQKGNPIYGGDIVYQTFYDHRVEEAHGFTGVVKQEEGVWWIDNEVDNAVRLWSELNLNHIKGNKFENPELLQGGNK